MSDEGLNADVLKEKQRDRFRVLKGMYDASEEGNPGQIAMFTPDAVATSLGMDRAVVWRIFDYLAGEGLTEVMASQLDFGH